MGLNLKISMRFVKAHVALRILSGIACTTSPCMHGHTVHSIYWQSHPSPSCNTHGWAFLVEAGCLKLPRGGLLKYMIHWERAQVEVAWGGAKVLVGERLVVGR